MKKTTCLILNFCFIWFLTPAFAGQKEAKELEYAQRYQEAYSVFQKIPYRGVFSYIEYEKKDRDRVMLRVEQNQCLDKKITILYPEYEKDLHILKNEEGVWGTPLSKEERDEISYVRHNVPWNLFFSESVIPSDQQIQLLVKNYNIELKAGKKVFQKEADLLVFTSELRGRPSLRVWLDPENDMILKRRFLDYRDKPKEIFYFEKIEYLEEPPQEPLSTEALTLIWPEKEEKEEEEKQVSLNFTPLEIEWLPKGFEKIKQDRWKDERHDRVVQTTSYNDGLAQLTVFQRKQTEEEREKQKKDKRREDEVIKVDRFGRSIFFIEKCGFRVSAVGDISPRAISKLLRSVNPSKTCRR